MYTNFAEVGDRDGGGFRFAFQDSSGEAAAAGGFPEPFDIAFDEENFVLSNCVVRRGPVTRELADIRGTVDTAGTGYIAVWLHNETYEAMALAGDSISDVVDVSVELDTSWYKMLLYKVERKTVNGLASVSVLVDYRKGAGVFLYV